MLVVCSDCSAQNCEANAECLTSRSTCDCDYNTIQCSNLKYTQSWIKYVIPIISIYYSLLFLHVAFEMCARASDYNDIDARINHYANAIGMQPRYLLTSLALNDFAIGILITPLGILPALFHCWPYGEIFCQIQVIDFIIFYQVSHDYSQ